MRIIGLAGRAGAGKNTAAAMLPPGFIEIALADPIKLAIAASVPEVEYVDFEDREKKEEVIPRYGVSRRHLARTLGTEWGRHLVHPDLWLLIAESSIEANVREYPHALGVVITDVRFPNEADWIHGLGGVVVRVNRSAVETEDGHASEQRLADSLVDYELDNDGDFDHLETQVRALAETVMREGTE